MSEKKLFRMHWDGGRGGSLEGLFLATRKDVDNAIGSGVYFGDVLGKYSEVYGTIGRDEIVEIPMDAAVLAIAAKSFEGDTWCGYNPLEYLSDRDESESEPDGDD